MRFQDEFTVQHRRSEACRVIQKYPDRVPVVCERNLQSTLNCPNIDKKKYLVPKDFTLGQFMRVVRNRLRLAPEKGLFLFIGNRMPSMSSQMIQVYNSYVNEDGFLYITYDLENVFG